MHRRSDAAFDRLRLLLGVEVRRLLAGQQKRQGENFIHLSTGSEPFVYNVPLTFDPDLGGCFEN